MDNPQREANEKITAVGCATKHYKGIAAQKKLALSRAIDEIAMQTKTTVSNTVLRKKSNGYTSTKISSLQSVNDLKLKTKIMAYYTKPDGDICVWVVKE